MLRTNSKKAVENIRSYIAANFTNPEDLGYENIKNPTNYEEMIKVIYNIFVIESRWNDADTKRYFSYYRYNAFKNWLQGLPSIFRPRYYVGVAVEILGDILEENEYEKSRYTEDQAEELLTKLIYREITKIVGEMY